MEEARAQVLSAWDEVTGDNGGSAMRSHELVRLASIEEGFQGEAGGVGGGGREGGWAGGW